MASILEDEAVGNDNKPNKLKSKRKSTSPKKV